MLRYTVNRVFTAAILMVMASVFAFLIVAAFPGNVAALIAELLGGFVSQDVVDRVAEEYRLNDPLIARYGYWVADVLNGNLGRSFRSGELVTVELVERLRPTFTLLLGGSIVDPRGGGFARLPGRAVAGRLHRSRDTGDRGRQHLHPEVLSRRDADLRVRRGAQRSSDLRVPRARVVDSCPRSPSGWCRARC